MLELASAISPSAVPGGIMAMAEVATRVTIRHQGWRYASFGMRRPRSHCHVRVLPHMGAHKAWRSVGLCVFNGHQPLVVISTCTPILSNLACELGDAPRESVACRVFSA